MEVLILGMLFCKQNDLESRQEVLWDLINPAQTKFVALSDVTAFLRKLQFVAIDIPCMVEEQNKPQEMPLLRYLRDAHKAKEMLVKKTMDTIKNSPNTEVVSNRERS